MNILLFTGAGASVELGVPAMRRMVEEFHAHIRNQELSPEILSKFQSLLADANYDMEGLIDAVEGIEKGMEKQRLLGFPVDEDILAAFKVIKQEAEWFVQHVCERITENYAAKLWGPALRRIGSNRLDFVTTNYDRSFEIGCTLNGMVVCDGFEPFAGGEFAKWTGLDGNRAVRLLKIHGSTDWYQGTDANVYKLRHPMPLYGGLVLSFEGDASIRLTSAIVLPSQEKKVTQPPYPDLTTEFRNSANRTDVAVFVGTSLRDPDIREVFWKCAARVPTYLVSRRGDFPSDYVPENAKLIKQSAGKFIVSVLPRLLAASDPTILMDVESDDNSERPSVLNCLVTALGEHETGQSKCIALEILAQHRISLDMTDLRVLLRDVDTEVRTYALALIQNSIDREEALTLAGDIANEDDGLTFERELQMLKELIEQGDAR